MPGAGRRWDAPWCARSVYICECGTGDAVACTRSTLCMHAAAGHEWTAATPGRQPDKHARQTSLTHMRTEVVVSPNGGIGRAQWQRGLWLGSHCVWKAVVRKVCHSKCTGFVSVGRAVSWGEKPLDVEIWAIAACDKACHLAVWLPVW